MCDVHVCNQILHQRCLEVGILVGHRPLHLADTCRPFRQSSSSYATVHIAARTRPCIWTFFITTDQHMLHIALFNWLRIKDIRRTTCFGFSPWSTEVRGRHLCSPLFDLMQWIHDQINSLIFFQVCNQQYALLVVSFAAAYTLWPFSTQWDRIDIFKSKPIASFRIHNFRFIS